MIRYIRTTKVPLTPELAMDFATMPAHRGERPKIEEHTAWLEGKIARGLFHPPRWGRAQLNGKVYRVNGQHSSSALVNSNGNFPTGLEALIDDYICDCDEDMAELFAQFDPKQSARTDSEIIMATARQFPALDNLKPTTVKLAIGAISTALVLRGIINNRVSPDARRAMVGDNLGFIIWSQQFTGTGRLRFAGSLAAMAETYEKNVDAATDFWAKVRDETHPDSEHPTRVLGKFLLLLRTGKEFNRKAGKAWNPRAVFAKCIHAWNADRTGTKTMLSYYENAPIPEARK